MPFDAVLHIVGHDLFENTTYRASSLSSYVSQRKKFTACGELHIESDRIGVMLNIELVQKRGNAPNRDDIDKVATFLIERLPSHWKSRPQINLVGGEPIWIDQLPDSANANRTYIEIPTQLTVSCVENLRAQWEPLNLASKQFRAAAMRLDEIAQNGMYALQSQAAEAWALFQFLENCIQRGNVGYLTGWYQEKMSRIGTGIEEVLRRKNANHPTTLRYLDEISTPLHNFCEITTWFEQPPSVHGIKNYLPTDLHI